MLRHFLTASLVAGCMVVASNISAAPGWRCLAINDRHSSAQWYAEASSLTHAKVKALNACVRSGVTKHSMNCHIVACNPNRWDPGPDGSGGYWHWHWHQRGWENPNWH